MIDDIRAARDRPRQIDRRCSTRLDAVLGKRGELAQLKTKLGALATVDEKRAAGQAVNEAIGRGRRVRSRPAGPSSPAPR